MTTLPNQAVPLAFIRHLTDQHIISAQAERMGLAAIMPYENQRSWIEYTLLFCGLGLILSSILYFFAFNWAALDDWHKLTSIQAALLICVLLTLWFGLNTTAGKLSSFCASFLVGVCLAVFGQIYQTGADAYQLFAGWALLTLPWVLLTRFAALWCLWLVVMNFAIYLYWEQQAATLAGPQWIYLALAGFNLGFLILRETLKSLPWLNHSWTRLTLVSFIFVFLNIFSCLAIFERWEHVPWLLMIVVMGVYASLFAVYSNVYKDIKVVSLGLISFCVIVETWLARVILDQHWGSWSLLWMFLLTSAMFGSAAMLLVKINQRMA